MPPRFGRFASSMFYACLVLAILESTYQCQAQASYTASKNTDISTFLGYSNTNQDYFSLPRSSGVSFGLDFTRYFHFPVAPSLEARANITSGSVASERSYLFGVRGEVQTLPVLPRIHPYIDFLAGPGNIHFASSTGYLGDNSPVYSLGGGADLDVFRNFQIKLDYQRQHWNTGEITFKPSSATFGVVYRFPFRPHTTQKDLEH